METATQQLIGRDDQIKSWTTSPLFQFSDIPGNNNHFLKRIQLSQKIEAVNNYKPWI